MYQLYTLPGICLTENHQGTDQDQQNYPGSGPDRAKEIHNISLFKGTVSRDG
jgi:hypothetical protein